jgi:hypothetical protein
VQSISTDIQYDTIKVTIALKTQSGGTVRVLRTVST